MTSRIKELAEQVGFGPAWLEEAKPGYPALPREGMLKEFAELIVRECMKLTENCYKSHTAEYADKIISKHFDIDI